MKRLMIFFVLFIFLLSSVVYAKSVLDVKTSKPGDKFTIGIPKYWNEKIYPSEKGTTYAYWDDVGNAITISVREPNSFKQVLTLINNGQLNEKQHYCPEISGVA